MIKVDTYTSKGEKSGKAELPYDDKKVNLPLLAQAMRVFENRTHTGTSRVKTRGEMTISTRKIYRQKGTGGARHGAKSAPIFVGGGVAHGPKGVKRVLRLPKKIRQKALASAMLFKSQKGEVVVVSNIGDIKKTRQAAELIKKIISQNENTKVTSSFLFALGKENMHVTLALRNLKNVSFVNFDNLNSYKLLNSKVVVIDKDVLVKSKDVGKKASETSTAKKENSSVKKAVPAKTSKKSKQVSAGSDKKTAKAKKVS